MSAAGEMTTAAIAVFARQAARACREKSMVELTRCVRCGASAVQGWAELAGGVILLVGPTRAFVVDVMLREIGRITPTHFAPVYSHGYRTIRWPNGAVGNVVGEADLEAWRGARVFGAWVCDLAQASTLGALRLLQPEHVVTSSSRWCGCTHPMTVEQAAVEWERERRAADRRASILRESEAVLKEWFRQHPEARDYEGRIGYAASTSLRLNVSAVKAALGERVREFQKPVTSEQLSLVKP